MTRLNRMKRWCASVGVLGGGLWVLGSVCVLGALVSARQLGIYDFSGRVAPDTQMYAQGDFRLTVSEAADGPMTHRSHSELRLARGGAPVWESVVGFAVQSAVVSSHGQVVVAGVGVGADIDGGHSTYRLTFLDDEGRGTASEAVSHVIGGSPGAGVFPRIGGLNVVDRGRRCMVRVELYSALGVMEEWRVYEWSGLQAFTVSAGARMASHGGWPRPVQVITSVDLGLVVATWRSRTDSDGWIVSALALRGEGGRTLTDCIGMCGSWQEIDLEVKGEPVLLEIAEEGAASVVQCKVGEGTEARAVLGVGLDQDGAISVTRTDG